MVSLWPLLILSFILIITALLSNWSGLTRAQDQSSDLLWSLPSNPQPYTECLPIDEFDATAAGGSEADSHSSGKVISRTLTNQCGNLRR